MWKHWRGTPCSITGVIMVTSTDDAHAGRVPYSVHGEHPKINRSYPQIAWLNVLNIPLMPCRCKNATYLEEVLLCSSPSPPCSSVHREGLSLHMPTALTETSLDHRRVSSPCIGNVGNEHIQKSYFSASN